MARRVSAAGSGSRAVVAAAFFVPEVVLRDLPAGGSLHGLFFFLAAVATKNQKKRKDFPAKEEAELGETTDPPRPRQPKIYEK
jgi:hypothetical protein